jgi:capsular exopolysaccharide synthesis family protein
MELKRYLSILSKRFWTIIVTAVLAASVTAAGSYYYLAPNYVASATVWVPTATGNGASAGDVLMGERLINTYAALATSRIVLEEVSRRTGVARSILKDSVEVKFEPMSELMYITARDSDPVLAASVATSVADSVIEKTRRTKAGRDLRVSLFAAAGVPDSPSWLGLLPTPFWREINIAIGLIVGLLAGIGLAFLFEYLDSTLYTKEQIESVTELATLGEIPYVTRGSQLMVSAANTRQSEAFRYLRTALFFFEQEEFPQTLLVTSAMPREGKSTIVANLAMAIAQSSRTVVVVDADLRLPKQHTLFETPNEVGLTALLQQQASVADVLLQTKYPGLSLIPSGPISTNSAGMLDSPQMPALFDELKQHADLVLVDTPSLLAVSDGAVLAPMADGVLLVVGQAQAHQEAVRAARQRLSSVGAKVMGVVVNRVNQPGAAYERYARAVTV